MLMEAYSNFYKENKMKSLTISFILLTFYFSNLLKAQITIDGIVTDSDLNPINNAFVQIIDEKDTANNYSTYTNESGYFIISGITDVGDMKSEIPQNHVVLINYPNPFNPSTIIYYELPKSENIEIKIYDILGREVKTLYDNFHNTGTFTLIWDGRNNWNAPVAAGVYLCRLRTKDQFKVHKMVLLDGGSIPSTYGNINLNKESSQVLSKINGVFNYSIRVMGDNILESEFKYLSCSGDTTVNLVVSKILQTAIIGPEGGQLEMEGFSLTVPEGAFAETVTLELGIESDSTLYSEEILSKVYRVDGIPSIYYKDLPIIVKLEKQSDDSISLAFGEPDTVFEEMEFINYDYYKAKDSSGFAVSIIPSVNEYNQLAKRSKEFSVNSSLKLLKLIEVILAHGEIRSSNDNFFIDYPESKAYLIPEIETHLEDAVETIISFGFNKLPLRTNETRSNWPVKVEFIEYTSYTSNNPVVKRKGSYSVSRRTHYQKINEKFYLTDNWFIYLNSKLIDENPKPYNLKMLLGRSVFDQFLAQSFLYEGIIEIKYWMLDCLWRWSEKIFTDDSDYLISIYDWNDKYLLEFMEDSNWDYVSEILYGLNFQKSSNANNPHAQAQHEAAFTALIEYITRIDPKRKKIIYDIHNSVLSQKSSMNGFIEALGETENIWWPGFLKEYIQGNILNVPSEKFLENVSKTLEFLDGDTLKYVNDTYNDLSAKLFRIEIKSDDIKNKSTLRFDLGPKSLNLDYVKTLVFGISNDNLAFLSGGNDFVVGNLFNYNGLLACVVNSGNAPPFTGTSNINLDVKVTDDQPFNHCDIKIRVVIYRDTTKTYWDPRWYTDGTFKDNLYSGIINTDLQGGGTGSINVLVDDNNNILALSVVAFYSDQDGSSEWSMTASGIPPSETSNYSIDYKYYDNFVCSYVKSIYAKDTESDGSFTEIKNFQCDANSYLEIKFHNWR
jgi:hypothetical protein